MFSCLVCVPRVPYVVSTWQSTFELSRAASSHLLHTSWPDAATHALSKQQELTQPAAQVTSSGNGTITGGGVYNLMPNLENDINIGFNVLGPANATLYRPTGVSVNGTACTFFN